MLAGTENSFIKTRHTGLYRNRTFPKLLKESTVSIIASTGHSSTRLASTLDTQTKPQQKIDIITIVANKVSATKTEREKSKRTMPSMTVIQAQFSCHVT